MLIMFLLLTTQELGLRFRYLDNQRFREPTRTLCSSERSYRILGQGLIRLLALAFVLVATWILLHSSNSFSTKTIRLPRWMGAEDAKDIIETKKAKCGLSKPCPTNYFAFKICSGAANVVGPSMCFENQIIMSPVKNNIGRGLNIALVNETKKAKCGLSKPCPTNYFAFKICSGAANVVGPSMCFENQIIMSPVKNNIGRGLNIALVNGESPPHALGSREVGLFLQQTWLTLRPGGVSRRPQEGGPRDPGSQSLATCVYPRRIHFS
ncbi:Hypothetical predicted protein [Marmota monax]|uniref:Uncharacterized protein n=1 Tax=Marmota monax TaxID=9995 RepID=A0A5E4B4P7_MARMO|nr:Hypothetical predicted protein [Marmota monax]